MQVSSVRAAASTQYAQSLQSSLAARAQTAAKVDSDGDHDGTTAAKPGRLDVKA